MEAAPSAPLPPALATAATEAAVAVVAAEVRAVRLPRFSSAPLQRSQQPSSPLRRFSSRKPPTFELSHSPLMRSHFASPRFDTHSLSSPTQMDNSSFVCLCGFLNHQSRLSVWATVLHCIALQCLCICCVFRARSRCSRSAGRYNRGRRGPCCRRRYRRPAACPARPGSPPWGSSSYR